ncbi:hypothetical protein WL04_18750 [Burkholderia ubonensis]|nr:hypothetical protein WJ64_20170 [Burkholderia ubonensis]KVP37751.1 hypothetical protein WJ89_23795 [Burkholderia ubonensis]KVQ81222.1 hypothetical protein WK06_13375 [Burkholderia ubonensis]KVQ91381.1 hypothetical protein WK09_11930 [Burkholderia ubonensis]KVR08102.1 hypothetical protein WK12_23195 [Burkholderia ubonensis]
MNKGSMRLDIETRLTRQWVPELEIPSDVSRSRRLMGALVASPDFPVTSLVHIAGAYTGKAA